MHFLFSNFKLIKIGFLPLVALLLFSTCKKDEEEYAADPNNLIVVSAQEDGVEIQDGKLDVKVDAEFIIVFSKPVDEAKARAATSLNAANGMVDVVLSFNDNSSIMALTPVDSLAYETEFTLRITSNDLGLGGETFDSDYTLHFTTEIEPIPLFASGMGTEADPYIISSDEELNIVKQFKTNYFKLANDINLSAISAADPLGWEPIGNLDEAFTGRFDGCGFTISAVTSNRPEQSEVGLFGVLGEGGEIVNLRVQLTGIAGFQAVGGLVGRQVAGTITNCHSSGSITALDSRVGGLVGSQESGTIINSSSSCGVFSEKSRVGGLVGLSQAGTVENSFATGNCESLSSRVGGLIGSVEAAATVLNSYSTGNSTAKNRGGGLFGRLDGSATACIARGNVSIVDADASGDYPGRAIGQLDAAATAIDIFYDINQVINYTGDSDITEDGIAVNIADLSCASPTTLFPNLDFGSTWVCVEDASWIVLLWE